MKYGQQVHFEFNGKTINGRFVREFSRRMSEVKTQNKGRYFLVNDIIKEGHVSTDKSERILHRSDKVHPGTGQLIRDIGIQ